MSPKIGPKAVSPIYTKPSQIMAIIPLTMTLIQLNAETRPFAPIPITKPVVTTTKVFMS